MLQYANRFGLSVEDVTKQPGEVFYFFGGRPVPESAVVEEFRDFVGVMRLDLVQLSQEVTAFSHTDTDVALDRTSLLAYLEGHNRAGIDLVGYGTNAKMMVGFTSRPWAGHGSNGSSYSDLANHQTTWETNPARATPSRAVLTDYSGGDRGETLDPSDIQREASRFLTDLDVVFPGTAAAARTAGAQIVAHLEHWPSNPLTRGSYTSYLPGQFTTIAGLEGVPAGNVFFAGEHSNSFYDYQSFMEGAALSGMAAAAAILRVAKH